MTRDETIALATEQAEELAVKAGPADLLAHEVVADHCLMRRVVAATAGVLRRSQEVSGADADLAAA